MYLRGLTATGGRWHAFAPRDDDPRPTAHAHGTHKTALCGVTVNPKQVAWSPTMRNVCKRCQMLAAADSIGVPADVARRLDKLGTE